MKFAYGLPVIIFGAVNIMMLHQVAVASQSEVNAIAQKITVRISGPKPGSGVIVDKQGNTYTVLTNWHVVDTAGTYTIQPQNGGSYQIKSSQVKRLSGVDLAFFNSRAIKLTKLRI
ncbi:MAG: trypsin-like peptidase domain-containing protein [Richelia sp. SM2_1_7]|nr:trypsin-like peptidase domain-containing protein [Richelia sp. SM2_1_7]